MPRAHKRTIDEPGRMADTLMSSGFGLTWARALATDQRDRVNDETSMAHANARYFWQHVLARIDARVKHDLDKAWGKK